MLRLAEKKNFIHKDRQITMLSILSLSLSLALRSVIHKTAM